MISTFWYFCILGASRLYLFKLHNCLVSFMESPCLYDIKIVFFYQKILSCIKLYCTNIFMHPQKGQGALTVNFVSQSCLVTMLWFHLKMVWKCYTIERWTLISAIIFCMVPELCPLNKYFVLFFYNFNFPWPAEIYWLLYQA